ncbi:MAG TPA: DUF732 domain-containing protein [Mycobacterium sp.]|jgi:hypothetical protein|nr:DUF732 domain-containing protein [Mycobacterium sp.]
MMSARHNITKLVGAAIAVAAVGLGTPGIAAAYTPEDLALFKKLYADGVDFSEANQVIQRARTVCDRFAAGDSPVEVHEAVITNSAFSPRQAAIFMADAVQAYCPQFSGQFMTSS